MTGYKIHYGDYGYDCWGRPEWCGCMNMMM